MVSTSFLPQSFLKVGNAAVLIQTWKCSSSASLGKEVYPFGYLNAQFGGGK